MGAPTGGEGADRTDADRREISRRSALGLIGGGTLAAGAAPSLSKLHLATFSRADLVELARTIPEFAELSPTKITGSAIFRAEDMLRLGYLFYNLKIDL